MTTMLRRAAVATVAALVLAACSGGSDAEPADSESDTTEVDDTTPTDITTDTTADTSGDASVASTDGNDTVDAGRCGVRTDAGYEPVDCADPHDAEFAGAVASPDDEDPLTLMAACAPSVEALTGRPVAEFGVDVGSAPGEDGDLECWAETSAPGLLSASIRDDGLDAAIGEFEFITDLADGTCFRLADLDAFDLATVVDCGAAAGETEMLYGQFEADDGPVPDDATTDAFFARCDELEAAAGFDLIGNSRYIISPLDDSWEALDRRTVLCVSWTDPEVAPADDLVDPAGIAGPVCGNYDEALGDYPLVSCDEPHTAEYAGSVAPPAGDLPERPDDAGLLLRQLCRESVESLTGRDLSQFGSGVGFVSIDGLGEPMVNDIRCYASTETEGSLVGAISEIGYEAALQFDIIVDQEPGTCFVFVDDDTFDLGQVVDCSTPDALIVVGSFEADAPAGAPHPGDDALREIRAERCSAILVESGVSADPATVSGTFPGEKTWTAFDRRTVTCDATPA